MERSNCNCWNEDCQSGQFEVAQLSAVRSGATVARVELWTCVDCGSRWLRYSIEDEANPAWSKWYRALVTDEAASGGEIAPEAAPALLARARWHYYGGTYYRTSGDRAPGAVPAIVPLPACGTAPEPAEAVPAWGATPEPAEALALQAMAA